MNAAKEAKEAKPERFYQGIGMLCGRVTVNEAGNHTIDIEGETFWFIPTKAVRTKLAKHLEAHPDTEVYLRVYPAYSVDLETLWFTAIAVYANKPASTQVNQFLLAGIWQYVPRLPEQPVMSIYRNSLRGKEKIKNNHLPVQGFAEEAYRYELKNAAKNTSKRTFYKILVSLNPQQRAFEYLVTLDKTNKIPTYVKKKYQPAKPSQSESSQSDLTTLTKKVKQMNFTMLKKTAIDLREAGFLEGKVSGRGITKETLCIKVNESLTNHPDAVKVLS